ncbi:MAG TPA: undecaprenyldiphospho-muramoylpentapeptide beta-N-acetylglucosaminyltransferase [Firmicutes bacterium]|nr:undecaprenyldiphospho-muramoylpentapeptide beta-N-acetylglucosaminyltransferase [Bacillota bacterium]
MRVLIAGGGTGGHIYPGLAVVAALRRKGPVEFLWVGASRGLEKDLVPREGIPLVLFPVQAFQRRLSLDTLRTVWRAAGALGAARSALRRFRPDVVLGTGGYACGPVVLAARLMGVPTVIQEQNALPGWTNRLLGRWVDRVALGFGEAKPYFPAAKVVVTGNPLRPEVAVARRVDGQARFRLERERKTVVVFGGSQGARAINAAFQEALPRLERRPDLQFIWVTGAKSFAEVKTGLLARGAVETGEGVRLGHLQVYPYLHDLPLALAAADLAVSRASAMALSEMAVLGLPAILIPLPTAAENHQERNARAREEAGAAVMLREADLTGGTLAQRIEELLTDPARLARMADAARALGKPGAAAAVANLVWQLGQSHSGGRNIS